LQVGADAGGDGFRLCAGKVIQENRWKGMGRFLARMEGDW
jgi:hypothetical protein